MTDTPVEIEETARVLRMELAKELEQDGSLRSPQWKTAVEAVPRHVFLPAFFRDAPGPDGITRYVPVSRDTGSDEWLKLTYQNKTWVTQLDHGTTLTDGEPVTGTPTSSSTLPGVVVRMLEDAEIEDGMSVFQAGGGTDYSTALMCSRLGDQFVTSREYDAGLCAEGLERLASIGYRPRLVSGDAAEGYPQGAPYDRIIATYSPTGVPAAWLEQTTPEALIVVSLVGSLDAYGYVRLRKTGPQAAEGQFINSDVSFMLSRETQRPVIGPLMRAAIESRSDVAGAETGIRPAILNDPAFLWAAQLALPGTTRLRLWAEGVTGQWFLHPDGSWAVLEWRENGTTRGYQGGPRAVWSDLEAVASKWLADDRPGLDRYGLTATTKTNVVWLDEPNNPVGTLRAT